VRQDRYSSKDSSLSWRHHLISCSIVALHFSIIEQAHPSAEVNPCSLLARMHQLAQSQTSVRGPRVVSFVGPWSADSGGVDLQRRTVGWCGSKWTWVYLLPLPCHGLTLSRSADHQIRPEASIIPFDLRSPEASSEPMTTIPFASGCAFAKNHPMATFKLVRVSARGLVTDDGYVWAGNGRWSWV
jgi:hypothetical protein